MPYIKQSRRPAAEYDPQSVGELTYGFCCLIKKYLKLQTRSFAQLAEVLAALKATEVAFVEDVLLPYERYKKTENGEVFND